MKKFKSSGADKSSSSPVKRKHESPGIAKGGFKSKEYISDDDSSDSDSGSKKKVAKVRFYERLLHLYEWLALSENIINLNCYHVTRINKRYMFRRDDFIRLKFFSINNGYIRRCNF